MVPVTRRLTNRFDTPDPRNPSTIRPHEPPPPPPASERWDAELERRRLIDVPAGTRLVGGRGWYSDGVVSVGFRDVATDSWQIVDIDRAQGLGRVIVAPPGVAADAVVGGGAQDGASRDVGAIFDQIMGSARLVPVK